MLTWYKYLITSDFSHLGFLSGNLFLIASFPDCCLLVPLCMMFSIVYCRYQQDLVLVDSGINFFSIRISRIRTNSHL